jgi:hypothetical protein
MVPAVDMTFQRRRLQHTAGLRADRQERRIGRAALFAEGRQHDRLDRVEALEDAQQHLVEAARPIGLGRRHEGVVEAEAVEERAQPGVVVGAEAFVLAERVADGGDRLVAVLLQHLAVGDVVRDLPQAVHVVGEDDQLRRDRVLGQRLEGVAHDRRPGGLAEGAQVRQARGPVTALEDHRSGQRREGRHGLGELALGEQGGGEIALGVGEAQTRDAVEQQAGLFEWPALRLAGGVGKTLQHGARPILPGPNKQLSQTEPYVGRQLR